MKKEITGIILAALVLLFIFTLPLTATVINDGEVGVKQTLGDYEDREIDTGLHFKMPLLSTIEHVNVRKQTINEKLNVPSNEGLIVGLEVSTIYKINPNRASEIKQQVSGEIRETLLIPYVRNSARDVVSGYSADALYSDGDRTKIGEEIRQRVQDKLGDDVRVVDILLRDVTLPQKVKDAIEEKINAEQQLQRKDFELDTAKKDAQIEVERAKGVAEANEIIAESITKEYIQHQFVKGLNDGNTEVIYVPTEGQIPIMEATRGK